MKAAGRAIQLLTASQPLTLQLTRTLLALCVAAPLPGCSSTPSSNSPAAFSSSGTRDASILTGPIVNDARAQPQVFQLDRSMQPTEPAEIWAEVKDLTSKVTHVRLQFIRVALEVRMDHIGGTTWRAQLTPEQLKQLAVAGQTMRYQANVIAQNEDGVAATSAGPVSISVVAPEEMRG